MAKKKAVPKKAIPKKADKASPKKSKKLEQAATISERSPGIVTKASDKKLFDELSQQLTYHDEPITGGMSEWSASPYHSGSNACVYTLYWSEDRLTVGLEVEVYRGTPPPDNIENGDEEESDIDDFDPYISAIEDGDSTIELEAIAILELGEEHDPESLVWELEAVHQQAGGTTITDPVF
jgi:hypothetical protein